MNKKGVTFLRHFSAISVDILSEIAISVSTITIGCRLWDSQTLVRNILGETIIPSNCYLVTSIWVVAIRNSRQVLIFL